MTRARDLAAGTFELATGGVLKLETSDTTVTDGSVLGKIEFKAPDEASGTDAILVGAAIEAVAEGTFAADNNATELVFKTGASAAANTKMTLTSGGNLGIGTSSPTEKLTVNGSIDLPTVNTFIKGGGHNVIQVDAAKTYFYGGTGGVQFRTADNASALIDITNAGNVGIGTASPAQKLSLVSGTFQISGTSSFIGNVEIGRVGGDNNMGFATGGTERMRIDSTGAVTMPAQPAFLVQPASAQNNIAVDTSVAVVFGTERFDQGGDFSGNTFTAPVTGKYQLNVGMYLNNVPANATYVELSFKTSNRNYSAGIFSSADAHTYFGLHHSGVLADMDAGDTAYIAIVQGPSSSTQQADIQVGTFFSGYLVA